MLSDKQKQAEFNLATLKRRDADITEILDMSAHVVLYQFNETTQAWDRKNVEGGLFVVARASDPAHMFVVMNRLSNDNVVEAVTSDFQMELTDQFLLYRNERQEINGIWFYAAAERASIAELLQGLVAGSAGDSTARPAADSASGSGGEAALQQATGGVPAPNGQDAAATSAAAGGSSPASTAAGEAGTASNVTAFFSLMQSQLPNSAPVPPMPTGATDAAATQAAGAAASVTATAPEPSAEPTQSHQPAADSSDVGAGPSDDAAELAALKSSLRQQLSSLLDDDGFMTILATEYRRRRTDARAAPVVDGASSEPADASPEAPTAVPAHLLQLLQQQQTH